MRLAAIDLGSNTVKMTVADVGTGGEVVALAERAEVTRIGERLDETGRLAPKAMDRTFDALSDFVRVARGWDVARIGCVGTAGLRGAENAASFRSRIREALGLEIEIIDGLREAELAYRAPAMAFGPGPLTVVDVGGRSTEVVCGLGRTIEARISLEIGSVRLTERHVRHDPPHHDELARVRRAADEAFAHAPLPRDPGSVMVGVSGTVMSVVGCSLDVDDMDQAIARGEGKMLSKRVIAEVLEDLRKKTTRERVRGTVIPEGRADVIVSGVVIMLAALDRYGSEGMLVTHRGVRYGLLDELAAT